MFLCFVYLMIKNRRLFATFHHVSEPLAAALEAWPWKNPQGILVSPMDKRHYRWLLLPNGLQVRVLDFFWAVSTRGVFAGHVSAACTFIAQSDMTVNANLSRAPGDVDYSTCGGASATPLLPEAWTLTNI